MPQQESRVKNTLLNARVNLIFYMLTLCLSFFSRKIFLDCLGTDFVGLTGTLQNLLGFLNLAELGIGSAIGYLLYKPLYDHDQQKISEIISVMGYLYRWIGLIILGGGVILSCFLPWIFPDSDTGFHLPLIYFAFYSFLGSSLIGYFINYRQNLLGADQRNYVVTAYFQSATIIKTLIQMALAYYTGNYYLWVVVEFTFGIIHSIILNWKINKTYPWLRANIAQGRKLFKKYPEVMLYTRQIFVHKISWVVRFQAKNILVYVFASLSVVAYYSNYMIIIDKLSVLSNNMFMEIDASIGNIIAGNNRKNIIKVYWELFSARFISAAIITFCTYLLAPSFITLWLGAEYLLSNNIFIIICLTLFIDQCRSISEKFLWGYGIFNDAKFALCEAVIGIALSILGGYLWGIIGVIAGPLVPGGIMFIFWKPWLLFREGFRLPTKYYFLNLFKYIVIFIFSAYITICLPINNIVQINSYYDWLLQAIYQFVCYSSILIFLLYIFTPGTKDIVERVKLTMNAKIQNLRHKIFTGS